MMKNPAPPARSLLAVLILLLPAVNVQCWGPDGHRAVGRVALGLMTPGARDALHGIAGSMDATVVAELCNWPDEYRATEDGAWSGPQHYINIPSGADSYAPARDCPGGACSAEAFKRYAADLGDGSLPGERRWRAWAWVCHLAGDIHQPMHNGFGHDRGGNDVLITFRGREMNLHRFWDTGMAEANYPDPALLAGDLAVLLPDSVPAGWRPEDVDGWVRESLALMLGLGYPDSPVITREFAAEAWLVARDRLALAAARLATVVNTVLAEERSD